MTIRKTIQTAVILLSVVACKGRQQTPSAVSEDQVKAGQENALLFPDVKVPSVLGSEEERVTFLAGHYWDGLTDPSRHGISDSLHVSGVPYELVEQHFSNYSALLSMAPADEALKGTRLVVSRLLECERKNPSSNVLEQLSGLAEKYLYDVNSPYRNEDAYGIYAEALAEFEGTDETMKGKYFFDARMCALNRVGTRANDFVFRDINGKTRNLYGLTEDYTLLFFSNPGCQACKAIIDVLGQSPQVRNLLDSGRLAVVNMYIDEDLEAWKSYMEIYPPEWYNVYDPDYIIRTDLTYNVRAIPSLYLLDKDKMVLMKDAVPEKMFWYLENQIR